MFETKISLWHQGRLVCPRQSVSSGEFHRARGSFDDAYIEMTFDVPPGATVSEYVVHTGLRSKRRGLFPETYGKDGGQYILRVEIQ